MRRDEQDRLVSCVACGAELSEGLSREFNFGATGVLCWDCAIARGGRYDAKESRWTEPPRLDDLADPGDY